MKKIFTIIIFMILSFFVTGKVLAGAREPNFDAEAADDKKIATMIEKKDLAGLRTMLQTNILYRQKQDILKNIVKAKDTQAISLLKRLSNKQCAEFPTRADAESFSCGVVTPIADYAITLVYLESDKSAKQKQTFLKLATSAPWFIAEAAAIELVKFVALPEAEKVLAKLKEIDNDGAQYASICYQARIMKWSEKQVVDECLAIIDKHAVLPFGDIGKPAPRQSSKAAGAMKYIKTCKAPAFKLVKERHDKLLAEFEKGGRSNKKQRAVIYCLRNILGYGLLPPRSVVK